MVNTNSKKHRQLEILKKYTSWNLRLLTAPFYIRLLFASFTILLALGLSSIIHTFTHESPYLIFLTAIMISTWFCGLRTGLFTTGSSTLLLVLFFVHFTSPFIIADVGESFNLGLFLFQGLLINYLLALTRNSLLKSELQRAEIIRNEKRFRLMIQSIKDYAIYFLSPEGFVASWNEGAEKIKGYSQKDVLGKHFSMFYTPEDVAAKIPWQQLEMAKREGKIEQETLRVRKNKSKFWAHLTIASIVDDEGKLEGFVTVIQDITERKLMEQRKDNFISIASHELKTPITSIKAFTQLVLKQLEHDDANKTSLTYLSRVNNQLNRLTHLVENLLDVTKIESGKLDYNEEVFDFHEFLYELIQEIQPVSTKHKIMQEGDDKVRVMADKYRISQVLTNLITNAMKYSPHANKIVIRTEHSQNQIIVAVQDFGIGIPQDQQQKVFERFYRVEGKDRESYPGLGLGLYISQQIMKRHHGKMWFTSEEGKGSTFYFSLPITLHQRLIKEDLKNN